VVTATGGACGQDSAAGLCGTGTAGAGGDDGGEHAALEWEVRSVLFAT